MLARYLPHFGQRHSVPERAGGASLRRLVTLLVLLAALAASVMLDLSMLIDGWVYPAVIGLALAVAAIYVASRRSRRGRDHD